MYQVTMSYYYLHPCEKRDDTECYQSWLHKIKIPETVFLTCFNTWSSWWRMGIDSYSAALEMISIRPLTLVLAFNDMLNNSEKTNHQKFTSPIRKTIDKKSVLTFPKSFLELCKLPMRVSFVFDRHNNKTSKIKL